MQSATANPAAGVNARVKLILTLAFIICLNLTPPAAWPAYILFFSIGLAAAVLGRVAIGMLLKRSLLVAPFALAALPLIFVGSEPHLDMPMIGDLVIHINLAGAIRFASILLKSWISLQAAILLVSLTSFNDLLIAVRGLGLPRLLVSILGLMWRYLDVFGDEARRLLRARASRSTRLPFHTPRCPGGGLLWRGRVTGGLAGSLLLRGLERSERVYAAMASRGYTGEPPLQHSTPLVRSDRIILITGLALSLVLLLLGLLTGGM